MAKKSNKLDPALRQELEALRDEMEEMRDEVEKGLRFCHVLMTRNQGALGAHGNIINGLGHILASNRVVDPEAVDQARLAYEEASGRPRFRVRVAPDVDKYSAELETVEIDCAARLPLCKGACCTQSFVLGAQDLDEGIIRWQYGDPYVNEQGDDGRCVHQRDDMLCTVHEQRPLFCRMYDCRKDPRIWLDFDRKVPNPSLAERPQLSAVPPTSEEDAAAQQDGDG